MSPDSALVDVLARCADGGRGSAGLHLWNTASRGYDHVSYADLARRSFAFGARLANQGCGDGTVCLIACHSPYATLVAFYGAISAAAVPMILPMPKALGSHQALVERIRYWGFKFSQPPVLVLESGLKEKFHSELPPEIATIRLSDSPSGSWDVMDQPPAERPPRSADIAFFQTTSSSTGDHKAVAIAHGNVLSNVHGIKAAVDMDETEKMISWLPLFHDMGLVGAVLFSLCHGYPLHLMTPTQFIKRPLLWLRGISDARCTITTAPNFGYDYCCRLISDKDAGALDLTCVKHFFIGAEPIRESTIRGFCNKFSVAGVGHDRIRPAYGLAESTIITTISRPQTPARFAYLDPGSIGLNQPVRVIETRRFDALDDGVPAGAVAVCTAGTAIADMAVMLVDEKGSPVTGDGYAGEIVINGGSVALGYVGDEGEPVDRFRDRTVATGDLGVVMDGELFIIERIKNVIIRSGENFLVSALEQRLADLFGVSHDNVAVFESDIHNPASDIVVLVEKQAELAEDQVERILANLPSETLLIDCILLHRARTIPRTTSGKKRHFYCRRLYNSGQLSFQQKIAVTPDRIAAALKKTNAE